MIRARQSVCAAVLGLAVALCAPPALAVDPFILFLLRMLRDQTISSSIESGLAGSRQSPDAEQAGRTAPPMAPLPSSESVQLKAMIDESFIHLGPQQRTELHASLMRILNDPKNAAARGTILSQFNAQALALRNSHRMLSRLSDSEMKTVAAAARSEFERLPPDQRQLLFQALQKGVPGMPKALQEQMVAEFGSVPTVR